MSDKDILKLELGGHQAGFEKALTRAQGEDLVARLWAGDHTLWQPDPDEISNRLGWLDIAERMTLEVEPIQAFAEEVKASGIERVLLLGMGGSSLAPEVFSKIFGAAEGYPSLSVLDSTHPAAVRAAMESHEPGKTLHIVATKSGGTVETLSFFKAFYNRVRDELGDEAGRQFAAITDPGSKLQALAQQFGFRRTFFNDPNIGGRYSALSYFGLVPAALLGVDIAKILKSAEAMAQGCRVEKVNENPGVRLGLALAALAQAGRDKATFILPPSFEGFGDWVEQLIAESTGKAGKGILPVVGEEPGEAESYGKDRAFIRIGEGEATTDTALRKAEHPILRIAWGDEYELGGQFFLWEFATAVAGYGLGINPFNQPTVEAAKAQARSLVEAYVESGEVPKADIEPFDAKRVERFLGKSELGDYVALQAYVPPRPEARRALQELRTGLQRRTGLATTLGFGPRYLHSTGQLHKGDAGKGLFIQLLDEIGDDVAVPVEAGSNESEIGFGVLMQAQAAGDAQALREAGRRVISLQLEGDWV